MMFLSAALTALATSASNVTLATFDGSSSLKWHVVNDPVMGGQSVSTFSQGKGVGIFDGEVKIVPSLHAAGFCNLETEGTAKFPDISSTDGLAIRMRNTGKLTGVQVTVSTKQSGTTFRHGDYSGNFTIASDGIMREVFVPFDGFVCEWRGEHIKCPPIKGQLSDIEGQDDHDDARHEELQDDQDRVTRAE